MTVAEWCAWWDVACDDLSPDEKYDCRAQGLFCCPEECEFCLSGYAAAEAAAEAEA